MWALIVRRQDLAGEGGGSLHDEPTHFSFELGEHARVILSRCLLRLRHYLFGGARRSFEASIGYSPAFSQRFWRAAIATGVVGYIAFILLVTGIIAGFAIAFAAREVQKRAVARHRRTCAELGVTLD